ncbi:MAG: RNA pseudouridine synthase [Treponema sp.]|jgi:23S rRNA pseudouridine1911/1915/1917 synthase|nr:RNA pseudouridine synthase [Treponema sp.]
MEIAYLDKNCVVVNKSPGESSEPLGRSGGGMTDLAPLLAERLAGMENLPAPGKAPAGKSGFSPVAVHRLDVPVSGCVLFARNPSALAFLNARFRAGEVEKIYWGISEMPDPGREFPETGELVHWLSQAGNKTTAYDEAGPGRKKAVLRYRVLGRGDRYLFLEIGLITGRHHQIRAQLARLGTPVKGDLKYGARRSEKGGGIRLHGYSIAFPDPAGTGLIRVKALPPRPDTLWEAFADCLNPGPPEALPCYTE